VLFTLPFFVEAMRSRIAHFDVAVEDAARDLGASAFQSYRMVTIPILAPTIIGAAILTFALSFDEFIITVFLSGNDTTLPLYIWSMMRRTVDPSINAASVVAMAFSILLLLTAGLYAHLQRKRTVAARDVA
jgi:ABC-type spermidine/putrescine transport system permease subunit II